MKILEKFGYSYSVEWCEKDEVLVWKNGSHELIFSKKDAAHFEAERETHNRYLCHIIENLPKIERSTAEIHRIVTTLEQQQNTIPFEFSYRFPKAIAYSSSKKKILLNPIKLCRYVEKAKEKTALSSEELHTFVFLHEYGHFLEDKTVDITKCGRAFVEKAKATCTDEMFLLTKVKEFLYDVEQNAWEKGKTFLPLFLYDEASYHRFSLIPLSSYENPSIRYLKEKLHYVFAP